MTATTWSRPTRRRGDSPSKGYRFEPRHRDPRPRVPDPRARGGPLLRGQAGRHAADPVLHRLPARARQAHEQEGDRVRDRRYPARRLREDPGDAPHVGVRRRCAPRAGAGGGAAALRPGGAAQARARARAARRRHSWRWRSCRTAVDRSFVSPGARRAAERGVREAREALSKEAYWRQKTWKRVFVIFAGPGMNLLFAIILFAALFMAGGGKATATVGSVVSGEPAMRAGLKARGQDLRHQRRDREQAAGHPGADLRIGRKEGPAAAVSSGTAS